jgi:hypothetical protein
MPRVLVRESLQSAKRRLAREQETRTERRVRALLQQRLPQQDQEIFDDSEEENRLSGRRARANRDQATQTDTSSSSFCCGVFVGVSVVVFLLVVLIFSQKNVRQRLVK